MPLPTLRPTSQRSRRKPTYGSENYVYDPKNDPVGTAASATLWPARSIRDEAAANAAKYQEYYINKQRAERAKEEQGMLELDDQQMADRELLMSQQQQALQDLASGNVQVDSSSFEYGKPINYYKVTQGLKLGLLKQDGQGRIYRTYSGGTESVPIYKLGLSKLAPISYSKSTQLDAATQSLVGNMMATRQDPITAAEFTEKARKMNLAKALGRPVGEGAMMGLADVGGNFRSIANAITGKKYGGNIEVARTGSEGYETTKTMTRDITGALMIGGAASAAGAGAALASAAGTAATIVPQRWEEYAYGDRGLLSATLQSGIDIGSSALGGKFGSKMAGQLQGKLLSTGATGFEKAKIIMGSMVKDMAIQAGIGGAAGIFDTLVDYAGSGNKEGFEFVKTAGTRALFQVALEAGISLITHAKGITGGLVEGGMSKAANAMVNGKVSKILTHIDQHISKHPNTTDKAIMAFLEQEGLVKDSKAVDLAHKLITDFRAAKQMQNLDMVYDPIKGWRITDGTASGKSTKSMTMDLHQEYDTSVPPLRKDALINLMETPPDIAGGAKATVPKDIVKATQKGLEQRLYTGTKPITSKTEKAIGDAQIMPIMDKLFPKIDVDGSGHKFIAHNFYTEKGMDTFYSMYKQISGAPIISDGVAMTSTVVDFLKGKLTPSYWDTKGMKAQYDRAMGSSTGNPAMQEALAIGERKLLFYKLSEQYGQRHGIQDKEAQRRAIAEIYDIGDKPAGEWAEAFAKKTDMMTPQQITEFPKSKEGGVALLGKDWLPGEQKGAQTAGEVQSLASQGDIEKGVAKGQRLQEMAAPIDERAVQARKFIEKAQAANARLKDLEAPVDAEAAAAVPKTEIASEPQALASEIDINKSIETGQRFQEMAAPIDERAVQARQFIEKAQAANTRLNDMETAAKTEAYIEDVTQPPAADEARLGAINEQRAIAGLPPKSSDAPTQKLTREQEDAQIIEFANRELAKRGAKHNLTTKQIAKRLGAGGIIGYVGYEMLPETEEGDEYRALLFGGIITASMGRRLAKMPGGSLFRNAEGNLTMIGRSWSSAADWFGAVPDYTGTTRRSKSPVMQEIQAIARSKASPQEKILESKAFVHRNIIEPPTDANGIPAAHNATAIERAFGIEAANKPREQVAAELAEVFKGEEDYVGMVDKYVKAIEEVSKESGFMSKPGSYIENLSHWGGEYGSRLAAAGNKALRISSEQTAKSKVPWRRYQRGTTKSEKRAVYEVFSKQSEIAADIQRSRDYGHLEKIDVLEKLDDPVILKKMLREELEYTDKQGKPAKIKRTVSDAEVESALAGLADARESMALASDAHYDAILADNLGIRIEDIPKVKDFLEQRMAILKEDIGKQKEAYRKSTGEGVKETNKKFKALQADELQGVANKLKWITRTEFLKENGRRLFHLQRWSPQKADANFMASIYEVDPKTLKRLSAKSHYVNRAKFAPHKADTDLYVREFIQEHGGKQIKTGEDGAGYYKINTVDEAGKPRTAIVKVNGNIDMNLMAATQMTGVESLKAEMNILLGQTAELPATLKDLRKSMDEFFKVREEASAVGAKEGNAKYDLADKFIDEMTELNNMIDSEGKYSSKANLVNELTKLKSYSMVPKAPATFSSKNTKGWKPLDRSAKGWNEWFQQGLDHAHGQASGRLNKAYLKRELNNQIDELDVWGATTPYRGKITRLYSEVVNAGVAKSVKTDMGNIISKTGRIIQAGTSPLVTGALAFNQMSGIGNLMEGAVAIVTLNPRFWKALPEIPRLMTVPLSFNMLKGINRAFKEPVMKQAMLALERGGAFSDVSTRQLYGQRIGGFRMSQSVVDKLFILTRMSERFNRMVSGISAIKMQAEKFSAVSLAGGKEKWDALSPAQKKAIDAMYIEKIVDGAHNFINATQGRFDMMYRSTAERAMMRNNMGALTALLSPAFNQAFLYTKQLRILTKGGDTGRQTAAAGLVAMASASIMLMGGDSIPGSTDVKELLNTIFSAFGSEKLNDRLYRQSATEKIQRSLMTAAKERGMSEKTVSNIVKIYQDGLLSTLTGRNFARENSISGWFDGIFKSNVEKAAGKLKKGDMEGLINDIFNVWTTGKYIRKEITQLAKGQYVDNDMTPLGRKYDKNIMGVAMDFLFRDELNVARANKAHYNEVIPLESPRQKSEFKESLASSSGIQYIGNEPKDQYIFRFKASEVNAKAVRDEMIGTYGSEDVQKYIGKSSEQLDKFIDENWDALIAAARKDPRSEEEINAGIDEDMYGKHTSQRDLKAYKDKMYRDIRLYYSKAIISDVINTASERQGLDIETQFKWVNDWSTMDWEKRIGDYPSGQQGYQYALLRFAERMKGIRREDEEIF